MESRADQVARLLREGLRETDVENELIRAEARALSMQQWSTPECLGHRVLEYLKSNNATALQVSRVLGAGLKQTHRAIIKLHKDRRITVVDRVESASRLGVLVNMWGRDTNGASQ